MRKIILAIILIFLSSPLYANESFSEKDAENRLLAWHKKIAQGQNPDLDKDLILYLYNNRNVYPPIDESADLMTKTKNLFTTYNLIASIFSNLLMRNMGYYVPNRAKLSVVTLSLSNRIVVYLPKILESFDNSDPGISIRREGINKIYNGFVTTYLSVFTLAFIENHGEDTDAILVSALHEYYPTFIKILPDKLSTEFIGYVNQNIKPNVKESKIQDFKDIQKYNN